MLILFEEFVWEILTMPLIWNTMPNVAKTKQTRIALTDNGRSWKCKD